MDASPFQDGSSFEKFNYALRPAKNMQRKMLCESLARLSRVSGLLAVGPLLGRAILPWQARAGLALVLSLLLTPLVGTTTLTSFVLTSFVAAAVTELGLGFLLGCGSLLILWVLPLAGRLLDQQHTMSGDEDDDPLTFTIFVAPTGVTTS